ncbi:MAG TPA: RDD family protein [Candidatus Limnocylindrales bacterium]
MSDNPQDPSQPPAGAPGAWPPPQPQPGWRPQPQPGWTPPPETGWTASPQPGWGPPPSPQPGWTPPSQPGYPPPYGQPYGQPGYPPAGYQPPYGYPPVGYGYPPRYAGFWIRFVAAFIDGLILVALIFVCAITVVGILAIPFVYFGYRPYLWWKRGATFGQSAVAVSVVRAIDGGPIDGGMATVRALIYYLETFGVYLLFVGLLGFIWAAFDDRKQAWHDKAAGTVVIHVN